MKHCISFYPGPAKIHSFVKNAMTEAFDSGILEQNHRSQAFMDLLKETLVNFKLKLNLPDNFKVYFTSSATECWQIIGESILPNKISFLANGAFAEKWFKAVQKIDKDHVSLISFPFEKELKETNLEGLQKYICLVQNETSNGTQINNKNLKFLKNKYPDSAIIADLTSSMAAQDIDWSLLDVGFCSVQKGFGLPPGMGILVVSGSFLEENAKSNRYNSLANLEYNFSKYQTPFTPNILSIYLLNEVLKNSPLIKEQDHIIKERAENVYEFIGENALVKNKKVRSQTVVCVKKDTPNKIIKNAELNNILLGKGYGAWKTNTLRIANFPAHNKTDFSHLYLYLKNALRF